MSNQNRISLPYRSLGERFVGRDKAVEAVHHNLQQRGTAVIQGVGLMGSCWGMGKSRLAIEYAHRFSEHYPGGIHWLDAARGLPGVLDCARDTGIPACAPNPPTYAPNSPIPGDPRTSGVTGRDACVTLLILDDFPEKEDLADWLPPPGPVRTLVTTQRQDLGGFGLVRLEPLDPSDSARLLTAATLRQPDEARQVAQLLGGLPLALQVARACLMRHPRLSSQALANWIRAAEDPELADFIFENRNRLPADWRREVAGVLLIGWRNASLFAQAVLLAMAFLGPYPVPLPLIKGILEGSRLRRLWRRLLALLRGRSVAQAVEQAVQELSRLALVDLDVDGNPRLHPLIASFVCCASASPQQALRRAVAQVLRTVTQASLTVPPNPRTAPTSSHPPDPRINPLPNPIPNSRTRIAEKIGARDTGIPAREPACEERKSLLLERGRPILMEASPDQSGAQAGMPVSRSRSSEAQELESILPHAEFLAWPQAFPPPLSVSAAAAIGLCRSIAAGHRRMGRLHRSLGWEHQALSRIQQHLPKSPLRILSTDALAQDLAELGLWEEACSFMRQTLEIAEREGAKHDCLVKRRTDLALLLKHRGLPEESAQQLRLVLQAELERSPRDPLDVAKAQSNLASVLVDMGRLEEAASLLRQALKTAQARLGPHATGLAVIRSNLASVLVEQGETEEARSLLLQAHEALLDRHGVTHTHTQEVARRLQMLEE